jgi:succinoglycan biosynthesis transport protein ExoP
MTPLDLPQTQPGLSDYLAILNRRKWVVVQAVAIVTVVAYVLSAQQAKEFQASADVLLTRQNVSNIVTGVTNPDVYSSPDRFAATQAGLARSPDVAARAIATAGVRNRGAGDLLANSFVSPQSNADLLRFTVSDADPEIAATLANAYARAFTSFKAELDTAQLAKARKELQARIADLRRSGQASGSSYQELVNSATQLRTMELLQTPNLVTTLATGAAQIAPTPKRNAMLGAFVGLLLGLGIAFLWETLDKSVRTVGEIERRLGLPLLARIPDPPKRLQDRNHLAMLEDPDDAHAEAIRRLRTNLEFANIDEGARVIMVTSAAEREGKSTTVSNLAVALARAGRGVVLVDLDLRQPTVEGYFKIERRPGATDVVLGRVALADALRSIPVPGPSGLRANLGGSPGRGLLSVIPCGELPASPGEFVGTQAVANLIQKLRAEYEFVLLDAPPILAVGDAMALSSHADAVLVVCRLGIVDRGMLADLARELEASPARKLGFAATGVSASDHYGYGYRYGHRDAVRLEHAATEASPPGDLSTVRTLRRGEKHSAAET